MTAIALAILLQSGPPPAPLPNAELTIRALSIAAIAGLPVSGISVYTWEPWAAEGVVDVRSWFAAGHVTIMVSPLLLEGSDEDGLDALLAHELAHFGTTCGRGGMYRNDDELFACESAADTRAATWVGRRTVIRGLCQLMAISWYWKYTTDSTILYRRIRLLHDRKDIP